MGYIITEINMFQESQIERCPNCVMFVLVEDDLASVIASVKGAQDSRRVVCPVAAAGDVADFRPVK